MGARSSMSAQDGAAPQQQAPFTPASGNGAAQAGANFQQVPQGGSMADSRERRNTSPQYSRF